MNNLTKEQLQKVYFGLYDQLPKEYAQLAKSNWDYEYAKGRITPTNMAEAIGWGFDWSKTPQKHTFWIKVYDASALGHAYPEIPSKPEPPAIDDKRFQAACAAMKGLINTEQDVSVQYILNVLDLSVDTTYVPEHHYPLYIAKIAVEHADALINELQKPQP
jgi:hypothetical protein